VLIGWSCLEWDGEMASVCFVVFCYSERYRYRRQQVGRVVLDGVMARQ